MSAAWTRRLLVVLGLVVAVLLTSSGAASAAFTARATVATTVGTATVAAPTGLGTAGSTSCGFLQTGYTVRVAWTASATARVTSYRVVESVSGVARPAVVVPATQLAFSRTTSRGALQVAPTRGWTITATTTYGWTSPVPATASYTC